MNRTEILEKAKSTVTKDRVSDYGTPEESFTKIAHLWSVYLGTTVTPVDAATMMILLKVARTMGGSDKIDNMVDIAGYAACAGELMELRSDGAKLREIALNQSGEAEKKYLYSPTVTSLDCPEAHYLSCATQREG